MNTNPKPIPEGYHTATPSLNIRGAADAITFYRRAFNATELFRVASPDGKILHAEIKIGNSVIILNDEFAEWGSLSPEALGGSPIMVRLYVPDVDAVFAQALAAGATVLSPVANQFWGDRSGIVKDPFGHRWGIASHVEDVPPDEVARRASVFTVAG